MKILISPAKSLNSDNKSSFSLETEAFFLKETESLVGKIKKMSAKKIGKLMHISNDLAELNFNRYQNWTSPNEISDVVQPAIVQFNGEVYKGIDVFSLSQAEAENFQQNVRILSGLYGILKPFDLMYPYRLEMGTKWAVTPKQKNLYHFWGKKIAKFLNDEMQKEETLINLASVEYFKVIDKKVLKANVITPIFKEFKNGEYKIIMMFAKHARGAMARYIVKNEIKNPEELKLYNVDGYSFDSNSSTENEWVFIR